jgi:hypothetical protein
MMSIDDDAVGEDLRGGSGRLSTSTIRFLVTARFPGGAVRCRSGVAALSAGLRRAGGRNGIGMAMAAPMMAPTSSAATLNEDLHAN